MTYNKVFFKLRKKYEIKKAIQIIIFVNLWTNHLKLVYWALTLGSSLCISTTQVGIRLWGWFIRILSFVCATSYESKDLVIRRSDRARLDRNGPSWTDSSFFYLTSLYSWNWAHSTAWTRRHRRHLWHSTARRSLTNGIKFLSRHTMFGLDRARSDGILVVPNINFICLSIYFFIT